MKFSSSNGRGNAEHNNVALVEISEFVCDVGELLSLGRHHLIIVEQSEWRDWVCRAD